MIGIITIDIKNSRPLLCAVMPSIYIQTVGAVTYVAKIALVTHKNDELANLGDHKVCRNTTDFFAGDGP